MERDHRSRRAPARGTNGKLAEVVAKRIEDEITTRGWPVGEVLGSEAQLLERHGVSRSALREAVRLLEHHQVASMRSGPGGGLVVAEPDSSAISRALALYLEYRRVDLRQILEVKRALELACVRLASERITSDGVARLRSAIALEKNAPGDGGVSTQNIHVLVAELTGNPALHLFVEVVTNVSAERWGSGFRTHAREISETHDRIAEAIIAGDAALAVHTMSRHLDELAALLR